MGDVKALVGDLYRALRALAGLIPNDDGKEIDLTTVNWGDSGAWGGELSCKRLKLGECDLRFGDVRAARRALEGLPKDPRRIVGIEFTMDNCPEEELGSEAADKTEEEEEERKVSSAKDGGCPTILWSLQELAGWHMGEHVVEGRGGRFNVPDFGQVAPCGNCGCLIRRRTDEDFLCDRCKVEKGKHVLGWKDPEREFEEKHFRQHLGPEEGRLKGSLTRAFIPGLGDVNECRVCGCLIVGGPNLCRRCEKEERCEMISAGMGDLDIQIRRGT